jgi:hypothetical protein
MARLAFEFGNSRLGRIYFFEFRLAKAIRPSFFFTIGLFLFPFSAPLLIQIQLRGESTSIQKLQAVHRRSRLESR